jgi:sugar phosphate isomerase/epimerase
VVYFSDKDKKGKSHLLPGEWTLDLVNFLKRLKKSWYARSVSVKLELKPQELANREKLISMLVKVREFYEKNFNNEK